MSLSDYPLHIILLHRHMGMGPSPRSSTKHGRNNFPSALQCEKRLIEQGRHGNNFAMHIAIEQQQSQHRSNALLLGRAWDFASIRDLEVGQQGVVHGSVSKCITCVCGQSQAIWHDLTKYLTKYLKKTC